MTDRAISALLQSLIDYAGLFPPAQLSMEEAARNYAQYRAGADGWALARFIVPAARLTELEEVAGKRIDGWTISALIAATEDFERIRDFNYRQVKRAVVDTIELKATGVTAIRPIVGYTGFFEVSPGEGLAEMLRSIRQAGARAKIRTGGVTAAAFPTAEEVVRFLGTCAKEGVSFKATAGLHHPLRCTRPLTYAADSAEGTMHGFVNLFVAATLIRGGADDEAELVELIEEGDPQAFTVDDDGIRWREHLATPEAIESCRNDFALSFGSCSFEEPLAELRQLGWL
jgi:hypothetical protein